MQESRSTPPSSSPLKRGGGRGGVRGKFMVLEGGEGAGKSSVARYLKERLPKKEFLFTREPGGTPLAERIRQIMISSEAKEASGATQMGLIFAARMDHVRKVINPALQRGTHVISERFDSATYAYQIFGQEAPELRPLFYEWRKLLADCIPDRYFLLDVDPAVGLRRMQGNPLKAEPVDQFEQRELAFHTRVHEGLVEFLHTEPHSIVDANQPLEVVSEEVLTQILFVTKERA